MLIRPASPPLPELPEAPATLTLAPCAIVTSPLTDFNETEPAGANASAVSNCRITPPASSLAPSAIVMPPGPVAVRLMSPAGAMMRPLSLIVAPLIFRDAPISVALNAADAWLPRMATSPLAAIAVVAPRSPLMTPASRVRFAATDVEPATCRFPVSCPSKLLWAVNVTLSKPVML